MPASYILHAVVPKWQGGEQNEYALLSSAYLSCLSVADTMGCKSLAFPLLVAGNNGFDPRIAFQIAKESIAYYQSVNSLETVLLIIYDETVKALILSTGTPVRACVEPAFPEIEKGNIMRVFGAKIKSQALGFAGDVLEYAEKYWSEHKEELIERGLQTAFRVLKNKHQDGTTC